MKASAAACLALLLALTSEALAGDPPKKNSKPEPARPVRVVFQPEKGEIELELDEARAPQTVKNFLAHAELDYGGKRNPDGQGFGAFGKVVNGMDVVRAIQQAPASGQQLTPPIQILRASRKR
jgi:cyclophilin family peptidyl-prolyl cis-trans isomerase